MPHPAQIDDFMDALGLVELASSNRAQLGDPRPTKEIGNALLFDAGAPSLRQLIGWLAGIVSGQEVELKARAPKEDDGA